MDAHVGPEFDESFGDVERRAVADVVGVRLERGTEHGDRLPCHVAEGALDKRDDTFAAAQVRGVDATQEVDRVGQTQLLTTRQERPDVLGQAATTEADASTEELAADALVVADRVGEGEHVAARGLADFRHGIDEADLRREERVGADLDEFRRRVVRHEARGARCEGLGVDLVELCDVGVGELAFDAVDETVGGERVLDGEALAQELRVPHEARIRAVSNVLAHRLEHARHRAHRHRGLADGDRTRLHVRGKRLERGEDIVRVGGVLTRALRGADTHEVDVGVSGSADVRAPRQAS